jgi:hypothetical protein
VSTIPKCTLPLLCIQREQTCIVHYHSTLAISNSLSNSCIIYTVYSIVRLSGVLTLVGLGRHKVLDERVRGLGVEGQGVVQGLQLVRLKYYIIYSGKDRYCGLQLIRLKNYIIYNGNDR